MILRQSHRRHSDPMTITLLLCWSKENHTGAILILWQSHWCYSDHNDDILILRWSHWCYSDIMTITQMPFWSYDGHTDAILILRRSNWCFSDPVTIVCRSWSPWPTWWRLTCLWLSDNRRSSRITQPGGPMILFLFPGANDHSLVFRSWLYV